MNRKPFYDHVRARLSRLTALQVEGFERILDATETDPLSHRAYILATAWHETAATMQPVREAYWLSEEWRKKNLRYWPWYGRGYVQITWRDNYQEADEKLGQNGALLRDPDKVMEPDISTAILVRGMREGWFTGVKLSSVLPAKGVATRQQYMNARTIVNGRDKADLIEDYAQIFERALRNGGQA